MNLLHYISKLKQELELNIKSNEFFCTIKGIIESNVSNLLGERLNNQSIVYLFNKLQYDFDNLKMCNNDYFLSDIIVKKESDSMIIIKCRYNIKECIFSIDFSTPRVIINCYLN